MARDLSPGSPEEVGLSSAGLAAIDAYLKDFVDRGELSGVVTLVARHGKVVHPSAIGKKDLESGEPMALDTMFRIYSMTKPVMGTAMSILYDDGHWQPDDPIEKHLPEFKGVKVFKGLDDKGEMLVEPAKHRVYLPFTAIDHPKVPPVKGAVRMPMLRGHWILIPVDGGKSTMAEYQVFANPGGVLPDWIANLASKTLPRRSRRPAGGPMPTGRDRSSTWTTSRRRPMNRTRRSPSSARSPHRAGIN